MVDSTLGELIRRRLVAIPGLVVEDDESHRSAAERDFGGISQGNVRAVVRPSNREALVALVNLANGEGVLLTARGLGYSQSGQSLPADGLSVDMSAFDEIDVEPGDRVATCGCAVTWRELLARTAAHGLAPAVMPVNLDLSIGGTLSAGGMGSTSHRYGMAVSTVESVGVVTGGGEAVEASRDLRRDIYDAVLGGAGQFGFICSAQLRLREMLPQTRTFYLLYDDARSLIADERRLMTQPWCMHLEGFASAAMQGVTRGAQGRRMPFARWFYGLQVSAEFAPGEEPSAEECLLGLAYRERLHAEDSDSVEFAARYDLRFEMMRATGAWQQVHPWLECLLPFQVATELLPDLVRRLPLFLGDGHRIMPVAEVPRPDLVMQPEGPPAIGFALLPAGVPSAFEKPAMNALRQVHEELVAAGGKRYLSGWLFEPDEAAWRRHYGQSFDLWRARKRELDPRGILRSRLFMP